MSEASRPDTLTKDMDTLVWLIMGFARYKPEELEKALNTTLADRGIHQKVFAAKFASPFHEFYHKWMDGEAR